MTLQLTLEVRFNEAFVVYVSAFGKIAQFAMRIYGPQESALSGEWIPPPVKCNM